MSDFFAILNWLQLDLISAWSTFHVNWGTNYQIRHVPDEWFWAMFQLDLITLLVNFSYELGQANYIKYLSEVCWSFCDMGILVSFIFSTHYNCDFNLYIRWVLHMLSIGVSKIHSLPRPRRGLRGIVFTRSVCLCVCLCVCLANILVFYFSAIRRDIDLKFIQDTYMVVLNSLKRSRTQGRYIAFWRYSHITKTEP